MSAIFIRGLKSLIATFDPADTHPVAYDLRSCLQEMQLLIGPLVHALDPTTIQYSRLSIIGLSSSGVIEFVVHDITDLESSLASILEEESIKAKGWTKEAPRRVLQEGEFFCPGFIDTHTHGILVGFFARHVLSDSTFPAPQFPNLGRGQQYELLDWLTNVTFPAEERLADVKYARALYKEVVRRTLAFGVCQPMWFGSSTLTLRTCRPPLAVIMDPCI